MSFRSGAAHRALFYPFLALPLFACSSSSSPDLHVDAASPIDASIPMIDSGLPTDAPLPKGLATCNDTAAAAQKGPSGIVAFVAPSVSLGDGVRDGADIGSFETATTEDAPMQGLGGIGNTNAIPLSPGDHVLENELKNKNASQFYTFNLFANADAKLLAYESASTIDSSTDIALRQMVQVYQSGITSVDTTPTTGAPTPEANDQEIFEIDAMAIFDATVSVRFTKDAACHVKNIAIILGQGEGPVALNDILASGDTTRGQIEKYAKTAPASTAVITMLTTLTTAPDIDLSKLSCTMTDLTTCDALIKAFDTAESGFSKIEGKAQPSKGDYLSKMMPNGWTYGTVETDTPGE